MKLSKLFLTAGALLAAFAFTSCSQGDDNGDSSFSDEELNALIVKAPELPASVGENPFKDFFGKKMSLGYSGKSIIFTENTFTFTYEGSNFTETTVYNYSFNTETSMLYGNVKSISDEERAEGDKYSIHASSPSEWIKQYSAIGFVSSRNMEYAKYAAAAAFNQNVSFEYAIAGNDVSFTEKFVSIVSSWNCGIHSDTLTTSFDQLNGYWRFAYGENYEGYTLFITSYDDNSFSGKVFSEENYKNIGSFKIGYDITANKFTYTIKEFPASLSDFVDTTYRYTFETYPSKFSLSE